MRIGLKRVKDMCGLATGEKTCAFLTVGREWECAKGTGTEWPIRVRLEAGSMNAKGDNCSGPPDYTPTEGE
jgi:hypothetical protein